MDEANRETEASSLWRPSRSSVAAAARALCLGELAVRDVYAGLLSAFDDDRRSAFPALDRWAGQQELVTAHAADLARRPAGLVHLLALLAAALPGCAGGGDQPDHGPLACGAGKEPPNTFAQMGAEYTENWGTPPTEGVGDPMNLVAGRRLAPTHLGTSFGWTAVPVTPDGRETASLLFEYRDGGKHGVGEISAPESPGCPLDLDVFGVRLGARSRLLHARDNVFLADGPGGLAAFRAGGRGEASLLGVVAQDSAAVGLVDSRVVVSDPEGATVLSSLRQPDGRGTLTLERCEAGECAPQATLDLPEGTSPLPGLSLLDDDGSTGRVLLPVSSGDGTTLLVGQWQAAPEWRLDSVSRQRWPWTRHDTALDCGGRLDGSPASLLATRAGETGGTTLCQFKLDALSSDDAEPLSCAWSGVDEERGFDLGGPHLTLGCGDFNGDGSNDVLLAGHGSSIFHVYEAIVFNLWPDDPATLTGPDASTSYAASSLDEGLEPWEYPVGTVTLLAPIFEPGRADLVITTPTALPDGTPASIGIFPWDVPAE